MTKAELKFLLDKHNRIIDAMYKNKSSGLFKKLIAIRKEIKGA